MSEDEGSEIPDEEAPAASDPGGKAVAYGCVGIAIGIPVLIFVLVIGGLLWAHWFPQEPEPDQWLAARACEKATSAQLKDPRSASFDNPRIEALTDTKWNITGVVRATNSFGGTVPAAYACTVSWNPATDNYNATSVLIE